MIKAGIVGANGYTGVELIKILSRHGGVTLTRLASRAEKGQRLTDVFPEFSYLSDAVFCDAEDAPSIAKDCDVVFLCLPHAASAAMAKTYLDLGVKVIDLSADFRYQDLTLYEKTYKVTHPCPELLSRAVYGLPELYSDTIKKTDLIGNPGCYTTSAILPLYPLIKEGFIQSDGIIIDAKSGTSGAGRKADLGQIFSEVTEDFKAYAVTTHRHTTEIEEVLTLNAQTATTVSFTPHLLPIKRGILSTIYARLKKEVTPALLESLYHDTYPTAPFVRYTGESLPQIKHVAHTNNCHIGCKIDTKNNNLILISCIDNLIKGASGQAVQNMNLMFGLKETAGLLGHL